VGSPHCVGMCGPLVVLAMRDPEGANPRQGMAYHGGRLASYLLLGALAGALGGTLNLGGTLLGFQRFALTASAVFLIAFGLHQLAKARGWVRRRSGGPPGFLGRAYLTLQRRAAGFPPVRRALGLGLLSSFLPCGWLYAFAAVAAGTGQAWLGMGVMGAFWLGTVPLLAAFGLGARHLLRPLERHLPTVTALVLVAAGLWVLQNRTSVTAPNLARAATEANPASALQRATSEVPSCCAPK
ncbi:MAG TPA: sulfite exporter TauE/SafE family protein, partial [Planctomycetota bacterium]|nr:sulfite exporter TauE/SafE family protein [Planctomycetota bacterium]